MFKRSHLSCLFVSIACLAPQAQAQTAGPLDPIFEDARAYVDPVYGDVFVEVRKRGYNVCVMSRAETSRVEDFWVGKYAQNARKPEIQAVLRQKFHETRNLSWSMSREMDQWMEKWRSIPESDFDETSRYADVLGHFLIQAAVQRDLGFSEVRKYCQEGPGPREAVINHVELQKGGAVPGLPQ